MEGKTCCVTGHRDLPQKEINHVKQPCGVKLIQRLRTGLPAL